MTAADPERAQRARCLDDLAAHLGAAAGADFSIDHVAHGHGKPLALQAGQDLLMDRALGAVQEAPVRRVAQEAWDDGAPVGRVRAEEALHVVPAEPAVLAEVGEEEGRQPEAPGAGELREPLGRNETGGRQTCAQLLRRPAPRGLDEVLRRGEELRCHRQVEGLADRPRVEGQLRDGARDVVDGNHVRAEVRRRGDNPQAPREVQPQRDVDRVEAPDGAGLGVADHHAGPEHRDRKRLQ